MRINPASVGLLFLALVLTSCGEPTSKRVVRDLERRIVGRSDLSCSGYEPLGERSPGSSTRHWFVEARCRQLDSDRAGPAKKVFLVTYGKMAGGWRIVRTTQVGRLDETMVPASVELPDVPLSRGFWVMFVYLTLPALIAVPLFVLALVFLRQRGREPRYDGAGGFRVRRSPQRPWQQRSHWTINRLDRDEDAG